jgi:hypothetical protein
MAPDVAPAVVLAPDVTSSESCKFCLAILEHTGRSHCPIHYEAPAAVALPVERESAAGSPGAAEQMALFAPLFGGAQ